MWSNDILSIVFTKIKVFGEKELKNKYPNITFVTSAKISKEAKFPTVFVNKLQGNEIGSDLDGKTINGIQSNIQIEVIDNQSQRNAEIVSDVIMNIMKEMRYQVVGDTYNDNNESGKFRNITRYRRPIGYNDIL